MSFWQKYNSATNLHKSYVCVGLDSQKNKIPEILKNEKNPIWTFNKEIIDATKNNAAAFKLNYAFYVNAGKLGLEALEKTLEYIPNFIPSILDVKVGDIGNTMEQYAEAYYKVMDVDSITVNPLMGNDVLEPLWKYRDKMSFVLTLTSNKTASDYLLKNDLSFKIAENIQKYNYEQIGAVVGATQTNDLKKIRELLPKNIFLIPGIGAQGGDLSSVVKFASSSKSDPRFLINSSRGIIFASQNSDFAEKASKATNDLKELININLLKLEA